MVLLNRKVAVLIAIVFSLCCIQLASAAIYYTPTYANVSENFQLNITISPQDLSSNISQVIIKNQALPPFAINYTSNQTSIGQGLFTFTSAGTTLTWFNLTAAGLTNSTVNQSFTLTINSTMAGAPANNKIIVCMYNSTDMTPGFAVRACSTSDPGFVENTTITIGMNFGFTGTTKLENGSFQPNTNVTIYDYVMGTNGPPSEVYISSVLTDSTGLFRLWGINGSKSTYKLKMFWANSTRVHYVGSNLPPFPANMFYSVPPPPEMVGVPKFKKMPTINGSTFYLQQAATINISATGNTTPNAIPVQFGYEVIDQAVGFPIESNVRNAVWNKEVIVPISRSYTVIAMRDPVSFLPDYEWCRTSGMGAMNDTACPAPPSSNQILSTNAGLIQGGYVNTVINLSYSMQYLSGCINLSGNTTAINITNVITRLTPWTGFVPPIDAKISAFNTTKAEGNDNLNYSDPRCPGALAFYNMSLMGSSSGTKYLIEFYGKNASDVAGNPSSAVNLAAFQNLTMTEASKSINVTLKPLAGAYVTSSTLNTTKMKIFVHNSSGSASGNAITTSMHVEVKVKHPIFGTMHYIVEDISNGVTYLPILANSTWAKVSVYPNEAPPVEKTLNLLAAQNNITVQVGEFTFRKPLANGSLQSINVSNKNVDATTGVNMTFYRNADGCNTPNPPSTCLLTQMDANDFNPMVVMMAGKVNLELKMTGSGTTLYFINFDLLSAKPPTNSIMSNNASSASANAQTWESGSFVPHVYDHAFVVMPYSETSSASNYINESYASFNMSLPYLKDENWAVAWNRSTNTTAQLPDDYADFNTGSYAPLLTTAGVACNLTNITDVCYMDKGNNSFVLKVPHFSGVGSGITGTAPVGTAAAAETPASTSGGSTGAAADKEVTESRIFATIATDSENTFRISNAEGIGVDALLFTATESVENVKIEVTKLVSKPSSVSSDPSGGLYKYIKIDAPKLEGKLKQAIIQFEVTKKWLDDNDYEPEHIRLSRYADGSWRELTTSILREETSKVYFESISPGFSYFAITAKKAAVEEETSAANATAPAEEPVAPEIAPAAEEIKESTVSKLVKPLLIIVGILVVLFIAVLGYKKKSALIFWREPTDKEKQEYVRGEFLKRKKQQSFGSGND